jgi:hypothetical protein
MACLCFLLPKNACSQTTTSSFSTAVWVTFRPNFSHLKLAHNRPEAIKAELLDTNIFSVIVRAAGLSLPDISNIQIGQNHEADSITLYQSGPETPAFNLLWQQLDHYAKVRLDGHTKAYALASQSNRTNAATIDDPDLRLLVTNRPTLAISWLKKSRAGTFTNNVGPDFPRWAKYTIVDGEIAWEYLIHVKADNSLNYIIESKCDAKEHDPKFKQVIAETEQAVIAEMQKDSRYQRFGPVQVFWQLKQEKLKAKSIEWRSPAELNPLHFHDYWVYRR